MGATENTVIQAIKDYVNTDIPAKDIAKKHGIKRVTLYSWLDKAGVQRRRQKRNVIKDWDSIKEKVNE